MNAEIGSSSKANEIRTHAVGECEMHREECDTLEMRKTNERDREKSCTSDHGDCDSRRQMIAQKAKQEGDKPIKSFYGDVWKNVMSKMLEVSLSGVGTVLRLERDVWSLSLIHI